MLSVITSHEDLRRALDGVDILLLWTAQGMGIKRGVHTSTMSVHYRERTWYASEEMVPLDTPSVSGLRVRGSNS